MEAILWTLLRWLAGVIPGFLAKRLYPPARMQRQIGIDVRPRGDPLTFDCGDAPYVSLWLTIRNGTPFPLELDRAVVDLWCQGYRLGDLLYLERTPVPRGAAHDILLRGLFGGRYEALVSNQNGRWACSVHVHAEFESRIGRVVFRTRQLEGITPTITNVGSPASR